MSNNTEIERAVNTIRFLSVDAVQTANSGHPGLPMGTAAIAYTIWSNHLKHNSSCPEWIDRDRFILSGGHGSALLYTLLHLAGYNLSLEELKHFRQFGSKTPGHPEYRLTPGVEVTTGPLGQGFANGVGMAISESKLAMEFNRDEFNIIDHYIYAIVTDGDLMEGISSEAASLAGHLKLGKLIYFYDDNRISIEGSTDLAFTEDRAARFTAYGWQVLQVKDGNNVEEINDAILKAKQDPRPTLIICKTTIGYGLPTVSGTAEAHGSPPGWDEINKAKEKENWPVEPAFYIPEDVHKHFSTLIQNNLNRYKEWSEKFDEYQTTFPDLASELLRRANSILPENWDQNLIDFPADSKGLATRVSSGKVINAISEHLPELIGGSADLAPSNMTWINNSSAYSTGNTSGNNIQFGVREHAMGAIINGISVHGGFIPFGGTFLVFSDYLRASIRIAALSKIGSIWVFTHDSIGVGEDGPTHQPVEQLMSLRLIPDLCVIRPCDASEVREAWKIALNNRNKPTALILSRQALPTLDRNIYNSAIDVSKGAYVLQDLGKGTPEIILMASGSEVDLIIKAGILLSEENIPVRLVSFPSWDRFDMQPQTYKEQVFPSEIRKRISVEAGVTTGWDKFVGEDGITIGLDHYGASAPGSILMKEFGFSVQNVVEKAKLLLKKE